MTNEIFNWLKEIPSVTPTYVRDAFSWLASSIAVDKVATPGLCPGGTVCDHPGDFLHSSAEVLDKITPEIAQKPLVLLVGGAFDGSVSLGNWSHKTVLDGLFPLYYHNHSSHQDVLYATWNSSAIIPIVKAWHEAGQKICLVGHSWGGDVVKQTADKLADDNIRIDLLCTVDPVSFDSAAGLIKKPQNVNKWINIAINYDTNPFDSAANFPAITGGFWGGNTEADINIVCDRIEDSSLPAGKSVEVHHGMIVKLFDRYLHDTVSNFETLSPICDGRGVATIDFLSSEVCWL